MNSRVFFSKSPSLCEASRLAPLFQEALRLLFPEAALVDLPDRHLKTPHTFFFRKGNTLLWAELVTLPFSRNEISEYLAKAREIQGLFSWNLMGILAAPDFETGARELLEWIRIPVRLFRYNEAVPLPRGGMSFPSEPPTLWVEEVTPTSARDRASAMAPEPASPSLPLGGQLPSSWNRLTREELREFISLELDIASRRFADPSHK